MTKIKGIDVSHYQGSVNWKTVKGAGIKFVFIKATQGTSYPQVSYFRNHAPKALAAGLNVGVYHYGTFSNVSEAKAQAAYFISVVKDYRLTYPLVLDLEENKKGVSKSALTDAAISFLEKIENAGYFAILYTSKSFLENSLDEDRLKPYALWCARYADALGRSADIWQYSSKGKVDGINGCVDMNWSYRDFAEEIRCMNKKPVVKMAVKEVKKIPDMYVIKSGDTLTEIADKYDLSVDYIVKRNSIKNKNKIFPGQRLRLKGKAPVPEKRFYKVRPGDTVSELAKKYGSTIQQIKSWNNLDSKYTIYAGKTIRVK